MLTVNLTEPWYYDTALYALELFSTTLSMLCGFLIFCPQCICTLIGPFTAGAISSQESIDGDLRAKTAALEEAGVYISNET